MTNIRRRDVRERYWRLLQDRALDATLEPMRELFRVRREIAQVAGFGSWADMRTVSGALGSVDGAQAVLADIAGPAAAAAQAFRDAATAVLADELRGDPYEPWDQFRAIRALTGALGADAAALKPYLPLDAVQAGLFRLAREVFGVRVEEGPGGLGWHEDVRSLRLIDDATDEVIGICLLDPWARDGKMAGTLAFMELLEADGPGSDGVRPPAVTMLVTMIPREIDGSRAMLGVFEAGVLFHEFGHVLDLTIGSRRGVTLDDGWWGSDWVEGPSFFLEYWARVPEVFATYARDPETGAPAPAALVDALSIAQAIEDVPYLATYVQRGLLDLAVHGPEDVDLDDAWRTAHAAIPLPEPSGAFRPFPISMIAGGYDAAVYGVCYALAIRDDLLDTFGRDGWLSPAAGRRYIEEVLRPGSVRAADRPAGVVPGSSRSSAPLAARMARAIEAARRASGGPRLSAPDVRFRRSFAAAMDEFRAEGRGSRDDRSVIGRYLRDHPRELPRTTNFAKLVAAIRADRLEDSPRPSGFVPSTELWWVDGDEYIGRIAVRHRLTPVLLEIGGHIGYDVRPTARRRGHATEMLRRALAVAHELGIDPALVTCDVDNVGSRTVIERNGGVLEDERSGKLRYWVPTAGSGPDRET